MHLRELMQKIEEILPGAEICWDNDNQIVIYTGLTDDEEGKLTPSCKESTG